MDVQQLFRNLKKEAECPLCLETVNDPKTLPCLHSFCLLCLDKHAGYARRQLQTTIKCPVCLACFQIPEGDTFGGLPTSFHLNRLVDLLALRDGSAEAQICSSCEENNTATCYCFVCQNFLCSACFEAHQRLKATRGHRNVLIENLQAQDVEELIHRPVMCPQKYHENEALEYYCQDCNVCICHKCSVVIHNRHIMVDIQQAAEEQKMQMTQIFARVNDQVADAETKIMKQTELMTRSEEKICAAEKKVTETVEEIIRIAREHETAMKAKLAEIKVTQQRDYAAKLENFQLFAAQLRSSVECGEDIVQRNIGPEILQEGHAVFSRCEELLTAEDIKICKPQHFTYCVNNEAINTVRRLVPGQVIANHTDPSQSLAKGKGLKEAELGTETNFTITTRDLEGKQFYDEQDQVTVKIRSPTGEDDKMKIEDCKDGNYTVRYKPKSVGLHDITVEVNGKPMTGSHWSVQVTGHQYKALPLFGLRGEGRPGEFNVPHSIAVSEKTGNIAIADYDNNRVQLFDSELKYLGTIGNKGCRAERIKHPASVAFTASGDVIVIHGKVFEPSEMFLFTEHGQFIKHISQHLIDPLRVSVRTDGHMIVTYFGDDSVKVVSPDGTELLQSFSAPDCDASPLFAVYHQDMFFVSYFPGHCVKVFSKEGVFLYDIGSGGSGDGQLDHPDGLAIDKFNNLIVCDWGNNRLQVFSLDGKFVNSVTEGMKCPRSVAVTKDGNVLVCDTDKHCLHVFQ